MKKLPALALSLFLASSSIAVEDANHPFKISPALDEVIHKGLHELYSFNFAESLRLFESVKEHASEHPMVSFGIASAHWWRISANVLEADLEESAPFLKAVEETMRISEEKIKKGDPTGEGHLVYGGALGLLGRYESTNRKWISAYRKGKRAYRHLARTLEQNPQMVDANMGKGIFDYYVATLPAIIRTLAFLGATGDAKIGLTELHDAAYNGTYARTPAKLFLVQIYAEQENKPEKALEILKELRAEYPDSPFIHMLHIIAVYNAGMIDDVMAQAQDFQRRVRDGRYPVDNLNESLFAMGVAHFKQRKWEEAAAFFEKSIATGDEKDPWRTWSVLYRGYVYDITGEREKAVETYHTVQKMLRRWGSHENAKWRLDKPFQADEKTLKKLTL